MPRPGRGQVLVEVLLSAVNEMDVQVRAGGWPAQVRRFRRAGPVLTGFELVGVARSNGRRIRAGQRVIGYSHVLNGARTHAAFVAMNENDMIGIPDSLDDEGAAALVVMGLTAVEVLERIRPLGKGDRCLVIGAAGGVGVYATQLAAWQGAEVTAVCSEANAEWIRALGAANVRISEGGERFMAGDAFDLVLDTPAVSRFSEAAPHLAANGVYVSTNPTNDIGGFAQALVSGRRAGWLMMLATDPDRLSRLVELQAAGALRPVIDSVHGIADADVAFDRFATRGKRGRVLLRIS
jgi:NADPH:quinone reductase-like Zn-dependent oxidoreductase